MKKSFTPNDLIFLAYCETKDSNDQKLLETMQTNEEVKREFLVEKESDIALNCSVSPSKKIIDNIMSYARALSVIKTERMGSINLLMN